MILRCSPDTLKVRLAKRGYSEKKVNENAVAEGIDVIWSEIVEDERPHIQIDTTDTTLEVVSKRVVDFIEGTCDKGDDIDWTEVMAKWY